MNVHSLYPSKFVAAGDLMGQDVNVTIAKVVIEKVGQDEEQKPVLYFTGFVKGMVMNRTNAKRIAALYGTEIEAWVGKAITIYPSETEFAGDTVPCLRVRPNAPAGMTPPPSPPPPPVVAPPVQHHVGAANGNGGVRF